jgi:chitosanase
VIAFSCEIDPSLFLGSVKGLEINIYMDARNSIKKILLAFEQSSTKIKYDKIYTFEDGPSDIKQITVSFGVTEYGNLKKMIKDYCFRNGKYTKQFSPYIPSIGTESLVNDSEFLKLLKESASDPIMQETQENAYDEMYINPAYGFCEKNGFKLNLSKLVVCDSYLQSGSILPLLRNMFAERPPINGGDEKVWIESYCKSRRSWLANHSRKILNKTVYRMDFMLDLIKKGDWELTQPPFIANGVKILS